MKGGEVERRGDVVTIQDPGGVHQTHELQHLLLGPAAPQGGKDSQEETFFMAVQHQTPRQSPCRPVDGLEDLLRRDAEGLFILVLPLPEVAAPGDGEQSREREE